MTRKTTASERASLIRCAIFDVDGVLTDGTFLIGDDGQQYKAFYTKDGQGLRMLQDAGVTVGIITGRTSKVVEHRMRELGVEHVYQGQRDKVAAYETILKDLDLAAEQVAYVGDDVIDLPVMRRVGLSIAVRDAEPLVKEHAHWITPRQGGRGAVRDACELMLRAQGRLDEALKKYLES
ncbi:3-Deoxy-D-manno-octulosonate 8-phosphate (KDO 8-P) phosphatase [gamma proteobacterium HTCC5015]|nr:3-Deoxy-D-manno-octulosonate 8-phosphate (KDO 8-P) phosphatase [gamma proteobacterium HTCC5015]